MSKGTPHRPIRIDDDLWAKAQAKAAQEGTTASEVARRMLELYVETRHVQPSDPVSIASNAHIATCPQCHERFS
jgi:negative regulator of replication initiation